jgi:hypothetical protein
MCHRIGHRNQVGFRAKADLASGPAANDLERLTRLGLWDHLVLAELFVPRPGQYEVFWMDVGSCSLL